VSIKRLYFTSLLQLYRRIYTRVFL